MEERMERRDFLKLGATLAGAAAVYTFLPGIALAGDGSEPVFAASAVARPSFMSPVIITPGGEIQLVKTDDASVKIESLWLQPAGGTDIITLKETADGSGILRAGSPLAGGLYDFHAKVTRGTNTRVERQPHAVKVVDSFKKDFVFGVISDVHFGDSRLSAKLPDFNVAAAVKKEIDIMNRKQVEFCLCCGDLCFIPPKTKNEIMDYAEALGVNAKFPIFTVPGNHDGYATGAGGKIQFDTFSWWKKDFGAYELSASYGDIAIVGINTYEKAPAERNVFGGLGDEVDTGAMSDAQLDRLDKTLARIRSEKPSGQIILIGHHNPTNTVVDVNGPFSIVPFSEKGRKELLALIEKYSPEQFFVGHVHGIHEEMYGKTRITTAPTAGSLPAKDNPVGFYIVKVEGGRIGSIETVEIARP